MTAECQACGACCVAPDARSYYVTLTDDDMACLQGAGHGRMIEFHGRGINLGASMRARSVTLRVFESEEAIDLYRSDPHDVPRCQVTRRRGLCSALWGAPGGPCSCSVYNVRPWVCSSFEPGGYLCEQARAEIGLSPFPRENR